jgi:hypothetical protein
LFDPADDRPDCLMGDAQFSRHRSESLSPRPQSDVRPMLLWDPWSFRHCGVPPVTETPSCVEQSLGIQEGNQWYGDHVYLA